MDRTKASLNSFVGLNRTLDYLEQIVREDIKQYKCDGVCSFRVVV